MQGALRDIVLDTAESEDAARDLALLHIAPEDFGHPPGTVLPPLQLAQAFSNRFCVTCDQVVALLRTLALPPAPSSSAGEQVDGSAVPAAARGRAPAAAEAARRLEARVAAARREAAAEARRAAQRERVDCLQLLFAHVVDLKHFSSVLKARFGCLFDCLKTGAGIIAAVGSCLLE